MTPPSHEPDFLANVRRELSDARVWVDRLIVLAHAAAAGLFIVGFTLLSNAAIHQFEALTGPRPWLALLWTPAWVVALVWITQRVAPGAAGSGIPQVTAAMDAAVTPDTRKRFVSLRLSCAKLLLTSGSMLAGLSVGREGPAVQVGAGVMLHARRWLSPRSGIDDHALLAAGGAAGIAAAFHAPLAGVVFCIEQFWRGLDSRASTVVIGAIVLAGLMAVSVFGNVTYFGRIQVQALSADLLLPAVGVVLACGLLGGLMARLLVLSAAGLPDRISRWRAQHPLRFAAACGVGVAVIGWVSGGATSGGGEAHTRELLSGSGEHQAGLFVLLKFVTTWLSTWSGVPGGIFAPSLSIGAGLGHDVAVLLGHPATPALIAMGMTGFLAAATQAPLTAFIIVMEMVDGHAMVLSLMAVAMSSSLVSRLLSRPLYGALAELQLLRVMPRG
ncbi:chloride channel protein [Caldimonas sp.]|uniref:chloride channel protein n=1 Tax=Caldimonas sp. TaxID=2838790 RepID=UPI0029D4A6FB|nr:chloride channel protein [Caldimonas manganoxidans]